MGACIPLFTWISLMTDNVRHAIKIHSESGYKVEDIELLEIAAHLFLKHLHTVAPIPPIQCEIVITNIVNSDSISEPLNGDMEEIKIVDSDNGLRYYLCRLADYTNSAETMRTLAHELTHVWQAANGSLSINEDNEWFWCGESYGINPYNGTNDDLLLPWEAEADTLDLQLVKQFYNTYFS